MNAKESPQTPGTTFSSSRLTATLLRAVPRTASRVLGSAAPAAVAVGPLPLASVSGTTFAASAAVTSAPARAYYVKPSTKNSSLSKVYADANNKDNTELWDYEHYEPLWSSMDDYSVVGKVGRGKYSEVFAGIHEPSSDPVVIKVLKPVRKLKIQREIKILERLRGGANVSQLRDTIRDPVSKTVCLVLDHSEAANFKTLYPSLTDVEVRGYLYQLLRGLDFAHSNGIMHRDIKPHNVTLDPATKSLSIIDWGLAEFYHGGYEYNADVASRYFKGPELLVNMKDYDYSLDVWSFGCVMAEMIFLVHPFLRGSDNADQLTKIVKLLGSEAYNDYVSKYNAEPAPEAAAAVASLGDVPPRKWTKHVNDSNRHLALPEALDLLSKVLVMDHQARLTAKEALAHPYFNGIREAAEAKALAEETANTERAIADHEKRAARALAEAQVRAEEEQKKMEEILARGRANVSYNVVDEAPQSLKPKANSDNEAAEAAANEKSE